MPPNNNPTAPIQNAQPIASSQAAFGMGQKKTKLDQASTQGSLIFSEIRNNMIIMKDGSFRAVVACNSINYDLMSDRERQAVEVGYQDFLNSLNFMVQILVRSKRIDLGPYIDHMVEIRRKMDNLLLGTLMEDYLNFISMLSSGANIMDKTFYVIVPYCESGDTKSLIKQGKGFFEIMFNKKPEFEVTKISSKDLTKATSEIDNRVNVVISGINRMGISCKRLDTRQISELFYYFYNPDTSTQQPFMETADSTGVVVRSVDSRKINNTSEGAQQ